MWYVYILRSLKDDKLYIGSTDDIQRRFGEHNKARVISTKSRTPFALLPYIAVEKRDTAINLEKYLKTGSGRAFLNKRIL
jgi:predicted GIY-YIG superfamily endonuclease